MRQKSYELNSNNNAIYTLNASTSKSKTVKPPDELDTGPETIKQDDLEARPENREKAQVVGFFTLFRFADCLDIFLMLIGCFVAMLHGAAYPALIYVYGDSIDVFISTGIFETFIKSDVVSGFLGTVNLTVESVLKEPPLLKSHCEYLSNLTDGNYTCDAIQPQLTNQLLDQMFTYTIYYIIIGCAVIVLGYLQITVWMTSAERQAHRIRLEFFRNVMRQEIGWFDTNDTGEVNSRLADDINKIHDGLGDKIGSSIQWISAFVAGCIIGFINGWKLTLVILSISPLLILASALMSKLAGSMTNKELKAYAKAGSIAEEVLSSIRTVVMFGGQKLEAERYTSNLSDAKKYGIRKSITNGLCMGFLSFIIMATYSLGFWYGTKLTVDEPDNYTAGKMLMVFYAVFVGSFSLGNASPGLQAMSTARSAAYTVYKLIDKVPSINIYSETGIKPETLTGHIEFKNVQFKYPARPDVKVLNKLCLDVKHGETVALVGSSGCGKSTTVQLLQRFYDVVDGSISIDDKDIKEYNIKWLRQHIGIVSQEPTLFATTIADNISYGRAEVTHAEIEEAAKNANAHDFISQLPQKYNTLVGERGAQLSGGQKQRIAIARALVRDPKILLLDEATSALDTESESVVQQALDTARQGRTTIVIAHRLSTIKSADVIYALQDGVVVEKGSHDELMTLKGIYYQLVMNQTNEKEKETDKEDISEEAAIEEEIEFLIRRDSMRRSGKFNKSITKRSPDKKQSITRVEDSTETEDEKENKGFGFIRMVRMNAPEWYYILIGCVAALLNGSVQPAFAIIFSEVLNVFQQTGQEREYEILKLSFILLGIGVLSWLSTFIQSYMFGKSGEKLTLRLRQQAFSAMLRQEMAWFDDEKNNTGTLTTKLATEASLVQGATGARLGMVLQNISSMGIALVIAFVFGWKLSLLVVAFLPLIIISGAVQIKILAGVAGKNKKALESAGKVAVESLDNVRTVASLSLENRFYHVYLKKLRTPYKAALKKAHLAGAAFGFSQAIVFFSYAASFYFGAYLVQQAEMNYVSVFRVFVAIVYGSYALGQASAFAPDASKAKVAAKDIFKLLDRQPTLNSDSLTGNKPSEITSKVEFKDVEFRYPTRPDVNVLQGLNIAVNPGETLALVGSSGCGKSTTVQILERFYDPQHGVVLLDKYNIEALNIQWLRSQMGMVSQEPVLFDRSIADNIAYGDNSRIIPMDEIITAARQANIHEFIKELPLGYETRVGEKGTQLSGGQKQRVAIARALIRNPKILLLDEATSALDTESEKVVQEALDKARQGRTTIVIAHRLSTIHNADKIAVIRQGRVIEQGNHKQLMELRGFYYKLNTAQSQIELE